MDESSSEPDSAGNMNIDFDDVNSPQRHDRTQTKYPRLSETLSQSHSEHYYYEGQPQQSSSFIPHSNTHLRRAHAGSVTSTELEDSDDASPPRQRVLSAFVTPPLHFPDSDEESPRRSRLPLSPWSISPSGQQTKDSEASESEEELPPQAQFNIPDDPLFFSRASMGLGSDDEDPLDDPPDAPEHSSSLPTAFAEHRSIRNAYVRAFVNSAFHGATHVQTQGFLDGVHDTISTLASDYEFDMSEDLEQMARTLRTVEKRLGVDPGDSITYHFVCPTCWKCFPLASLSSLQSENCPTPHCADRLFDLKPSHTTRKEKRIPRKIVPMYSIRNALKRLLMRPGIYEALQHWRKERDEPGPAEPISHEKWLEDLDWDKPMTDIYDGWMWRSLRAFSERVWKPRERQVVDEDPTSQNQRFVSLPMGLVMHLHVDW